MNITLWSFDKKKNSTKIPSTAGNVVSGELKDPFAITELSIKFNFGQLYNAPTYNYCYIPNLRRYYFIINWLYDSGLWIAVCAVDVLASFKTDIGNSRQFVERSYSKYNADIIDTAYLTRSNDIVRMYDLLTTSTFWGASALGNNGTVVIGVVGSSSSNTGAVTYYAMSQSTFGGLMNTMLSSISWAGISGSEISTALQKALINPTQYIISCRWYPIVFSGFNQGTATTSLNLGWWSFNLGGTARILSTISSALITRTNELSIPKNPWKGARTDYLDLAPYSTYYFKFLPFGIFEIDSTELYDKTYLGVKVDVDLMTGSAVLRLCAKDAISSYNWDNAFLVTEGQVGVTIPIGQVSADIGKYKNALIAGTVSGITALYENAQYESTSTNHHSGKF